VDSDNLAPVDSENTVLYAILLWINHSPERRNYLPQILPLIRFTQLRKFYLLSVPLMLKGYPPEVNARIKELFNEAIEFKVGGPEWMKSRVQGSITHKRFTNRPVASNSNPFIMSERFTGVNKWVVDKPQWSDTHFSNGYSVQFYVCKSQQSFGAYLHIVNQFIEAEEFCLPLSFTIYLLNKVGTFDRIRTCKSTFRRTSKGVPNLGVNHDDFVINNSMTIKIEVAFEQVE